MSKSPELDPELTSTSSSSSEERDATSRTERRTWTRKFGPLSRINSQEEEGPEEHEPQPEDHRETKQEFMARIAAKKHGEERQKFIETLNSIKRILGDDSASLSQKSINSKFRANFLLEILAIINPKRYFIEVLDKDLRIFYGFQEDCLQEDIDSGKKMDNEMELAFCIDDEKVKVIGKQGEQVDFTQSLQSIVLELKKCANNKEGKQVEIQADDKSTIIFAIKNGDEFTAKCKDKEFILLGEGKLESQGVKDFGAYLEENYAKEASVPSKLTQGRDYGKIGQKQAWEVSRF